MAALHVGPMMINPSIVVAAVVTDERIVAAIRHFIALKFTEQPYEIFATVNEARIWIAAVRSRYALDLPRRPERP